MQTTETVVKTAHRGKCALHVAAAVTAMGLASVLSSAGRRLCFVVLGHVLRFRPRGIVSDPELKENRT